MDNPSAPTGFPAFYAETYTRVMRCVRPLAESAEDAGDLVQDAFARAYAKWESIRLHPEPEAWVKRVAINLARSRLRRARLAANKIRLRQEPIFEHDLIEDRTDLSNALKHLPPRQRIVLVMHYLDDLPVKEVARVLGASEASVKTNLHRARAQLSRTMRKGPT